ncbi:GAF domain-containing protein [Pontibacter sp. MBLB2868]|uniref:GAF domain-containing protein n=1 Tax=Pontibacter sp. MBLB2868 TaxID=3451555 RepID=UPI003F75330E
MKDNLPLVNQTTKKDYDSEFCGSIPLHLVNLIQPYGCMLVLDKRELHIAQVSENIADFISATVEDVLDKPLADFVTAAQYEEILSKADLKIHENNIPLNITFTINGKEAYFTALIHPKDEYVLLELEENKPSASDSNSFLELYQQVKFITSLLKNALSTPEIAQVAADSIKKLAGFDSVLVYQFDPKWNGIVIAQAKEDDMADYMGLRFPASDVPKQARDLYFSNPFRLIPNRVYTPVRLLPVINPLTQRFTDLSDCNLRSVATVHLEYMANMNIMASMSLPLIIGDKLWGLISCHHKTPIFPGYELRSALELLCSIISGQLAGKEAEVSATIRAQLKEVHAQLLEQLYNSTTIAEGLLEGQPSLSGLLNLSGAAIVFEGSTWTSGEVPTSQEIKELVAWFRRHKIDKVYATDNLPNEFAQSKDFKEIASGLIVLPINAEQGEYMLGFRKEITQIVKWGGNPNKAIQMEPDGKTYHPRNSFSVYQEQVKFTSLPWQEEELEAADAIRNAVLEKIIRDRY